MGLPIVTVNISVLNAPAPITLQSTGAFISQGATTIGAGNKQLLTQLSDLTGILNGTSPISTITWNLNVATATTVTPHGLTIDDTVELTISGATPSGYNGTFLCTVTGNTTFTYPLANNPGGAASGAVWTEEDVAELVAMATTFFAQGASQSVYVLELGAGNATDGTAALSTYITANPNAFYAYLLPRTWDGNAAFLAFVAGFENLTAKTYFFVTTTTGTYSAYTSAMKCVFWGVEAPGIPATEFSLAAAFHVLLSYAPSPTNLVTPFAFSYLYGVTSYPTVGNSALLAAIKAANGNYVGTGAEGGISTAVLFWGTTADGNDFTYWYSIDWVQLACDQAIANAIINGSNNPSNPLYYSQQGINTLQNAVAQVMSNGVSYGLVLFGPLQTALIGTTLNQNFDDGDYAGQTVVNAVPFLAYVAANPSDYPIGKYAGLIVIFTPNRGFKAIVFNVQVNNLPAL